jgi:uncharacterized protein DUF4339
MGPIAQEQFDGLVRAGTITPDTLVWREGMSQWQPYGTTLKTPRPSVVVPAGSVTCSECGNVFAQDEAVSYGGAWVCAACKPVFLQRIKEGLKPMGVTVWRSGKLLVMKKGSGLPDACVKCNAPAQHRLKRKLYWHHPAVFLLILLSLLIYVIVALIIRKRADVEIGLCDRHAANRKRDVILSWSLVLLGLGLIIAAVSIANGWVGLAGGLVLVGALVYAAVKTPVVSATKIDAEYVWLRGVSRDYLQAFPDWSGPK